MPGSAGWRYGCKVAGTFALAALFSLVMGSPLLAVSREEETKLTNIEKHLFFKTYTQEPIETRIGRVEKRFFGEAAKEGSVDQRLQKVFEAAGPQIDADGTTSGGLMTQPEKPVEPPASNEPAKTGGKRSTKNQTQREATPTTKTTSEPITPDVNATAEDAWDAATKNALAARDEEINKLLAEAVKFWKKRNAEDASAKFNQVVRLDPQNAEAYFSLGVIAEAKGELKEASALYFKAHDINPDRMDYKDAIQTLNEKLEKKQVVDKAQGAIDQEAGEAADAFKRKEYITALELYKRLEGKFPKKAVYKYNIGTIYLMQKSPIQALEYYEKAHKTDPKEPRYETAYAKLKATVEADEAARAKADAAWDQREKDENKKKKDAAKQAANNQPGKPNQKQPKATPGGPIGALGIGAQQTLVGIQVTGVSGGTRAAKAGLKNGDVIVAVDGINIQNLGQLSQILQNKMGGAAAQLIISRSGKMVQLLL